MRFELDIDYEPAKMELSRQRMAARGEFRYVDRVPILYCAAWWHGMFSPLFGLRYIDYFTDVETQYYWQLQFAKYRIENTLARRLYRRHRRADRRSGDKACECPES